MTPEPAPGRYEPASPTDSGRASPISRKWRGEEAELSKDKGFRRYASGVERSLSLFDTQLQEWADYISFLGRLLKSLQARPSNITVIPSNGIVARRLAQCLNPTLPSGVHQKAIEVYNYVFSTIGTNALSRDLALYLPGLSATLSFASLTVRSPFLALLQTHLLPLDPAALRPALKAIILALLPGLEEETSEDFDQTLKLLNGFKKAVRPRANPTDHQTTAGDEYFWQCFFLASITGNNRRLGALAYLARSLPKLGSRFRSSSTAPNDTPETSPDHAAKLVTTPEPGLLLRCFAAGLKDDQILIQRGFLDLLVSHLPLHANVFQKQVKSDDLELLMTAASGVVARRDMSLNRRLWSWLLGPEPVSVTEIEGTSDSSLAVDRDRALSMAATRTTYFEDFGLRPLTDAILKLIVRDSLTPAERARPFRICLSLMDRWEIGGLIVPEIFLPAVSSVRKYQTICASKADFNEVLRSASVFFDGVESGLIWSEITGLIAAAVGTSKLSNDVKLDKLSLVKFILSNFNVREEEMLLIHAPITALMLLAMLDETAPKGIDSEQVITLAINVALDLIELIPERGFVSRPSTQQSPSEYCQPHNLTIDNKVIMEKVRLFYEKDQGNLDISSPPFYAQETSELLLREATRLTSRSLSMTISSADVAMKTRLLVALITKASVAESLDITELLSSILEKLSAPTELPFSSFASIIAVVTTLYPRYLKPDQISNLIDPLVRPAWYHLSPSCPKYHVEAVRSLWQLQTSLGSLNHEIEASLCRLIVKHDVSGTFAKRNADPGRRIAILWTHTLQDNAGHTDRRGSKPSNGDQLTGQAPSMADYEIMLRRPVFLLLDALSDERTQLFTTIRIWIQNLSGIDKLFELFIIRFAEFKFLHTGNTSTGKVTRMQYSTDDDIDNCVYYLRTLLNILRWSTMGTWATLANTNISIPKKDDALGLITAGDGDFSLQEFFLHVCLQAIKGTYNPAEPQLDSSISQLHRAALALLRQILANPFSSQFAELELESRLIDELEQSLTGPDPFIQVSLLEVVLAALKLKKESPTSPPLSPKPDNRALSSDVHRSSALSVVTGHTEKAPESRTLPPSSLLRCFQAAFVSPSTRPVLDNWVIFLAECIPLFSEAIFQVLIPLVETLCSQISQTFETLRETFKEPNESTTADFTPEATLISLLNGLELILMRGHERLLIDEARAPTVKSPDQPQGFFGNMVSGVFSTETQQSRTQTANNRLTVLLSFQDAVEICFKIWSWGGRGRDEFNPDGDSVASFSYTSLRMRNRARRLLEHLFHAEALECLETVIGIWQKASIGSATLYTAAFHLLHVLDGSRPKHTIPAIFDAIYSRTNPSALDPSRKSTLTSTLLDIELVVFLVDYANSLEDDAMDEIWADCITFLKDILANPFPHRQILPGLLEFTSVLGEKVDNTNFGEQRRMRKELGDLFLRLLTATFTTNPMGFSMSTSQQPSEKPSESDNHSFLRLKNRAEDVVLILVTIAPSLAKVLVEPDRVLTATSTISTSVIGPTFRSKAFPENVTENLLTLLYRLTRLPNTQKAWKKDLGDAFNDPRFFSNSPSLYESHWVPLIRQWAISDKERMPELLSRLTPPTTAGIVFGVGATSARLEADRKTQLNLRRIAALILSVPDDTFVTDLAGIYEKIVELLAATTTSSPSSTTRAEIYILLRALVLKTSPIHLAFMWPTVNDELYSAISSVVAADHSGPADTWNSFGVLQACKLLDTLLCIAPDDFQLHEWLFITDTIDAIYKPDPRSYHPVALVDRLTDELGSAALSSAYETTNLLTQGVRDKSRRRLLIGPGRVETRDVNMERKDELVAKVLRPFFSQLSIWAFETVYEMGDVEWEECRRGLVEDLFDERGFVKAL